MDKSDDDANRDSSRAVPEEVTAARRAAHAELMRRLATRPALNVPPWTREELYEDETP
jgi:hypothetical protein